MPKPFSEQPRSATEPDTLRSALLVLLAVPWVVHGLVVASSAVGLRPLGSRIFAGSILAAALAVAVVAVRLPSRSTSGSAIGLPPAARGLATALSTAGFVAAAVALVFSVVFPVVAYDALAYRLPVIADWLDQGRIAWLTTDDAVRNGYPLGQEAVAAVISAATGSMRFGALVSFFHVGAGALAIWLFAERIGVRRELARAAAALFLLVPMVILNAPSGYVDASFAGATVACVLLSALAFGSSGPDLVLATAAGMAAAHALSLKGTGIAILAAVSIAVVIALVLAKAGPSVSFQGIAARLLPFAAFATPGAFWILRNFVHTGNPLWPVDVRVAGHALFHGVASMESVLDVVHNTPAILSPLSEPNRLLHTWFEVRGPALDFDARLSGLGLAWPFAALPAIVFTVMRVWRRNFPAEHRAALFVALGATAIAFFVQPMRWWPRYTIWVWGAGAVCLATTAEALIAKGRHRELVAALSVVTGLAVVEAGVSLFHANGFATALQRPADGSSRFSNDVRVAPNAASWVDAAFFRDTLADASDVCRGAWKPGTDDANLDGVFAQLSPRPRVHVVADDDGNWSDVQKAWKDAGCTELFLLRGSPVLPLAHQDPDVTVEPAVAFDPLYVVRQRHFSRLAVRNVSP